MICDDPVVVTPNSPADITNNNLLLIHENNLPQELVVIEPWIILFVGFMFQDLVGNIINSFLHKNTQADITVYVIYNNKKEIALHNNIENIRANSGHVHGLPLPGSYLTVSNIQL
jgi:hypothetical protein